MFGRFLCVVVLCLVLGGCAQNNVSEIVPDEKEKPSLVYGDDATLLYSEDYSYAIMLGDVFLGERTDLVCVLITVKNINLESLYVNPHHFQLVTDKKHVYSYSSITHRSDDALDSTTLLPDDRVVGALFFEVVSGEKPYEVTAETPDGYAKIPFPSISRSLA